MHFTLLIEDKNHFVALFRMGSSKLNLPCFHYALFALIKDLCPTLIFNSEDKAKGFPKYILLYCMSA
jgi:hypothetical protein